MDVREAQQPCGFDRPGVRGAQTRSQQWDQDGGGDRFASGPVMPNVMLR
jgi:hypothetical protein